MPPMSAGRRPEMLELDALSCGYGPFVAVHGLDLPVPAWGVVALVGANGPGKSSKISAVAGTVAVHAGALSAIGSKSSGEIEVEYVRICGGTVLHIKKQIL